MWSTPASLYYLRHLRSCACGASGSNTSGSVSSTLDICFAIPWNTTFILPWCFPSAHNYDYTNTFFDISHSPQLPAPSPVATHNASCINSAAFGIIQCLQLPAPSPASSYNASIGHTYPDTFIISHSSGPSQLQAPLPVVTHAADDFNLIICNRSHSPKLQAPLPPTTQNASFFDLASFDMSHSPQPPASVPSPSHYKSPPFHLYEFDTSSVWPCCNSENYTCEKLFLPELHPTITSSPTMMQQALQQIDATAALLAACGIILFLAVCRAALNIKAHCSRTPGYCGTHSSLNLNEATCVAGAAAWYKHSNGKVEKVTVLKVHSASEGGGYTIWVPSIGREKQTVLERLEQWQGLSTSFTTIHRNGNLINLWVSMLNFTPTSLNHSLVVSLFLPLLVSGVFLISKKQR
jgi:hypothetical protein